MTNSSLNYSASNVKVPTGIPGLDEMCGGGVFESSTTLITGPSGTGKTTFCMHFVKEGLKNGERALFISFEESRAQLLRDAMVFSWGLEEYEQKGLLTFVCKYPEGAFLDEHLSEFKKILKTFKPKRLVIDSISSLQSSFTEKELGKFSKKILSLLKEEGITSFLTTATVGLMSTEMLSESHLSIFTDNILLLKYVETGGALSTVVSVIKTRGSHHDNKLRTYEITPDGVVLGGALSAYEGIMAGATRKVGPTTQETLKEEFVRTLGPMGEIEFYKLARKTLSRKGITKYIDSLLSDGILKKAKAKKFKENCVSILMEDHAEPFIATGGE